MGIDEEVSRILNDNRDGFTALRSLLNHDNLGAEVPEELDDMVQKFIRKGVLSYELYVGPGLLMILDEDFYAQNKTCLAERGIDGPVYLAHTKLPKGIRFVGISGAVYPFEVDNNYIMFIEMDSSEYFNSLDATARSGLAEYFFRNIPLEDATLIASKRVFIAFGTRLDGYEVKQVTEISSQSVLSKAQVQPLT